MCLLSLPLPFSFTYFDLSRAIGVNFFKRSGRGRKGKKISLEPKKTIDAVSPDFTRNYEIWQDTILCICSLPLLPIEQSCICLLVVHTRSSSVGNIISIFDRVAKMCRIISYFRFQASYWLDKEKTPMEGKVGRIQTIFSPSSIMPSWLEQTFIILCFTSFCRVTIK